MKKIIPYTKDITFKTNIATISSISLVHDEKVFDNEVTGEFALFGEYKIHNDTTEKELFKYKLPFAIDFIEDIDKSSVVIEIDDFNYEVVNDNILRVNIKFSLTAQEISEKPSLVKEARVEEETVDQEEQSENNKEEEKLSEEIFKEDSELEKEIDKYIKEEIEPEAKREEVVTKEVTKDEALPKEEKMMEKEENDVKEREDEIIKTTESEFVIYHIHIVSENETLEEIMKKYECTLDDLRLYNEITNINVGDKIIIPEKNE